MRSKKGPFSFPISILAVLLSLSACLQAQQEDLITPTQNLAPTPLSKANCLIPNSHPTILQAETGPEAEQAILDYLNQGGTPEQLQIELNKLGPIVNSSQVFTVDTNADDLEEVVLAINFAPPEGKDWEEAYSSLSFYSCSEGTYHVTKITGGNQENINILAVENLLNSDVPEILLSSRSFYISSCDELVEMYSFTKRGWVSSFETDVSPCEMQTELKNRSNGHKQLIVVGNKGCSYSSCGPQRGRKWIYEFGNSEVTLINDELLPSSYRIHTLEDGEIAIERGDLETAIEFYDKAAQDNGLIDVLTTSETDQRISQNIPMEKMQQTAHDYQTAFAYFREFILLHYLNRDDEAAKIFDQIKTVYPEGKNGNEFVDVSSYFLGRLNSGSAVQEACEVTNEYLAEKYILSENDFVYPHLNGWGDLSLQIGELLCPVVNLP